ncbi:MAG TPA: diphosphate--fructose-6-phosphate 1-phosphotransferase [Candidatus Tyrphobacter sp.]
MEAPQGTLAILVGGGPAPGINGVIASATIEAIHNGLRVIGIYDGYRHLVRADTSHVVELGIDDVSMIHATGGSILRTSRTNPAEETETLDNCVRALVQLKARYLIAIGGDDTTYGAGRIAASSQGRISVVTVPKTIDNDLPLPDNAPTFGFETARSMGAGIIETLMVDARTTARWYLVVSMGRKSGALALSMCKAAGAELAVIPEEFPWDAFDLNAVVNTLVGAMVKRKSVHHNSGVAVVAEGIVERLSEQEFAALANPTRDAYGHVRLADIPIGLLLRDAVRRRLDEIGVDATIVAKDIGYELRCAKPVPFDVDYTQTLGYGAVRYLLEGGSGALIALSGGRVIPVQLTELQDPATGRVRVRMVDVTTESYRTARSYMTRLERADLREPNLSKLAALTNLSPGAFAEQFRTATQ